MSAKSLHTGLQELLQRQDVLTVSNFMTAFPDAPVSTVYSRIRALTESGRLSSVGKGKYVSIHKPSFQPVISPWMREVHQLLASRCEGISHCITQRECNLFIYAAHGDLPAIQNALTHLQGKVLSEQEWNRFPGKLEGFIILAKLVSDSPVLQEEGMLVPSLEKELVDRICDERHAPDSFSFQKVMEVYPVNLNRLNRFAARRGATKPLSAMLDSLDRNRLEMMNRIQRFLAGIPVKRAWIFGSFARGEETDASDVDLLVDYEESVNLSLLDVVRYKLDLEKVIGREVDLVENGYLQPFAVSSAERDKYLVYER